MKRILCLFCCSILPIIFCSCSRCDYNKPDTKANRKGFCNICGFAPNKETTGIFFYADEWGQDAAYWLAFSAPQEVIDNIIKKLELKKAVADWNAGSNANVDAFPWWSTAERNNSQYYRFDNGAGIVRELWYNPQTQKCQMAITYQ